MNMDVFDGMKGKLTQAHIDKGVRDMCRECPLALSISDMLAQHKRADDGIIVEVGTTQVRLHTGDWEAPFLVAQMDSLLEQWVDDFDKGKRVPTGTISIRRNGFITDVEKVFDRLTPTEAQPRLLGKASQSHENSGGRVQRWRCGLTVDQNT